MGFIKWRILFVGLIVPLVTDGGVYLQQQQQLPIWPPEAVINPFYVGAPERREEEATKTVVWRGLKDEE